MLISVVLSFISFSDIFSIWGIDSKGCLSDTLRNIKLGQPGKVEANMTLFEPQCFDSKDGSVEITLIGGASPYNYVTTDNNNLINQGIANQGVIFELHNLYKGDFLFQMTDLNNCSFDTVFNVTSPDKIIADFNTSVVLGWEPLEVELFNQSIASDNFTWDFGDGEIISTEINDQVNHVFLNQGQYLISLIASNSLLSSFCNDTSFIEVNVEGFDKYNVFSPNGDNKNDYFNFREWGLSSLHVDVFNRWGQKVYHWNLQNNNWDGKGYNGENLPEGVYYFSLELISNTGVVVSQTGNITLLR